MGLQDISKSNKVYLTTFQGNLCEMRKTETDGFERAESKNATTGVITVKYVKRYGGVSGQIKSLVYNVVEWQGKKIKSWNLTLVDGKEFVVQFSANSKTCISLFKTLPNIDITKELNLVVFPDKETGGAVIMLKQDGEKVPWAYTKEDPNGLPPGVKDAQEEWDFRDQNNFLHTKALEFAEKLPGDSIVTSAPVYNTEPAGEEILPDEGEIHPNDIPF